MVKYSPKENTYKEMYLINKFEKDVMENSLQNMRNDKTKTNQKVPVSITTSSENDKDAIETPNKKETQSKQGNEPLVSNENDIEGFTPEILNSSIEKEKLPNDKPLSVNENTPTSKKRIDRNISRNNSLLTPSDLKRTPHNSTPLDRDNILEKRANPNTSKNDFSLSPSSFQRILDTEKRAIKKIKKISKNEKKLNGIKSSKLSDKRITRKMAKSTNNITHNKAKKRIVVKNSDKAISITPLTKKKKENKNKSVEEVFHGWNI